MPLRIASTVRKGCALAVLGIAAAFAGEAPHELVGLNQEQIVRRLGEPRSQLQAGNRLVMLYPRERITLRDGVVVDVEILAAEPPRRTAAPVPAAPAPAAPPLPGPIATQAPAPATVPQPIPVAPAAPSVPAPATSPAGAQAPLPVAAGGAAPTATGVLPGGAVAAPPARADPSPPLEPESRLGIKLVRPPSAREPAAPPVPAPAATLPTSRPLAAGAPAEPQPGATPGPSGPPPTAVVTPPAASPVDSRSTAVAPPPSPPSTLTSLPAESPREIVERASREPGSAAKVEPPPPAEKRKDSLSSKLLRERLDRAEATAKEESGFPWIAVGIGAVVLAGGIAFLLLRRRGAAPGQATTAAAREAAPSGLGGIGAQRERTTFTAEGLSKLEWKRFQEIVEAYYSKTGVVALRTRTGPQSPVHIKISWKGESRPFACVRCISQPRGAIGPAPLEELLAVLDAENIRRGYVVTPGSFSSAARDLAERKQLTLMAGETLLEKLNALPESARAEIMQLAMAGDPTVPSCPVCEAKMSLSREHPPTWRCASHPDKSFPAEN